MRFLVDENLPPELGAALNVAGHDAVMLISTRFRHAPDWEVADFAISEERLVITRDVRFPVRRSVPIPGLILLREPPVLGKPEIVETIMGLIQSPWLDELPGRITVLRRGRVRSRTIPHA